MTLTIALPGGLGLTMPVTVRETAGVRAAGEGRGREASPAYPTGRLQRGLLLAAGDLDLAEEGVGFAVPVLKLGARTVFPGGADVRVRRTAEVVEVEARFRLDLVERLARRDGRPVGPRALYAAKDGLAALHRRLPPARGALTATSSSLRQRLGWVTTYVPVAAVATVPVLVSVDTVSGRLEVSVQLDGLPPEVTEVALMNEQGACAFDRYEEPGGLVLDGERIGTWDVTGGPGARFVGRAARVFFALEGADGAVARRGRELVGARLAWAGFGLVARPGSPSLAYTLRVGRLGA